MRVLGLTGQISQGSISFKRWAGFFISWAWGLVWWAGVLLFGPGHEGWYLFWVLIFKKGPVWLSNKIP